MILRKTFTQAKRVSSGSSTNYIYLDGYYDNLIVTSTLTGVVTAYLPDHEAFRVGTADNGGADESLVGVELPALTAGTYNLHIKALKCATGADAAKLVVSR